MKFQHKYSDMLTREWRAPVKYPLVLFNLFHQVLLPGHVRFVPGTPLLCVQYFHFGRLRVMVGLVDVGNPVVRPPVSEQTGIVKSKHVHVRLVNKILKKTKWWAIQYWANIDPTLYECFVFARYTYEGESNREKQLLFLKMLNMLNQLQTYKNIMEIWYILFRDGQPSRHTCQ